MSRFDIARRLAFAARCAAAGALTYLLATRVGLPHPVWASMSSLIVSQDSLDATRHSIVGRVIGTIAGAVAAILVSEVAHQVDVGTALQIAAAVGLCALFAGGRPAIRVCLWTCPVVLLTASPGSSVAHAGLMRGSEVILGALSGGLIHWLMHWMTDRWDRCPSTKSCRAGVGERGSRKSSPLAKSVKFTRGIEAEQTNGGSWRH